MIIKLRHFIRILKKIILQVHQFILSNSFSLIGINFSPRIKTICSVPMPSSHSVAHMYFSLQLDNFYNDWIILQRNTMNKLILGILLILMMFGHNYVLNQPQVLQAQFQQIHSASVPKFNLLYSIPSFVAIFFIIPLGVLYDTYAQIILIGSAIGLVIGQLLVAIFGANSSSYAFPLLTLGRVFEGTTAQVLYMIQANLSSSWMGKLAGLTLILPEVGQIANVFLTLFIKQRFGVSFALVIGFLTCLVSFIASVFLYRQIKKHKKLQGAIQIMVHSPQTKDEGDKDLNMIEEQNEEKEMTSMNSQKGVKRLNQSSLDKSDQKKDKQKISNGPKSIFKTGRVFWLVVLLCAINECLYFPFLDNAKVMIQTRFCVSQEKTGFYLCLPYLSAILVSILVGEELLYKFPRHKLIFCSSLLPFIGHLIIYLIANCQQETSYFEEIFLIIGFVFFGMGIAGYYSICMPAVGLSVPQNIRGTAFACLGFLQTLTMTAVPLISGQIIEQDSVNNDNFTQGYRNSSFFFVFLCIAACIVSLYIMLYAKPDSFKYQQEEEVEKGKSVSKGIEEQQSRASSMVVND